MASQALDVKLTVGISAILAVGGIVWGGGSKLSKMQQQIDAKASSADVAVMGANVDRLQGLVERMEDAVRKLELDAARREGAL